MSVPTISLHAPASWPFTSPVVPARFMPSGRAYSPGTDGLIAAVQNDVPALLGFGFYVVGAGASPLTALSDVTVASPADSDVLTWVTSAGRWENKPGGGGGGTPGSPAASVQYNNAGAFGGASLHYDGSGFSTPFVSTYVSASVIGAAIVNAGTGGTPGAATVTGTTGTGTKFQATVTIEAGGTIESIDSISIAGAYTIPPTDPANEPVTGGGLTGAVLALGMNFAPSIIGSDATRGFNTNALGDGGLVNAGVSATLGTGLVNRSDALIISSVISGSNPQLSIFPGLDGEPVLEMVGFGSGNYPELFLFSANGVQGHPAAVSSGQRLFDMVFGGHNGSTYTGSLRINGSAAEDFSPGHKASEITISTTDLTQSFVPRIAFDGAGNTNIENGVLVIATPRAIAALPASPVAGMFATVDDAMTPTIGLAVVSGGAASAVVCYGGTQWTVVSI